jgi:large subunit ribosomal protein L12
MFDLIKCNFNRVVKMNLIYAALLLHSAKKEINEENLRKVAKAVDENVDEAKIKALVAALEGINIDEAISKAYISPTPPTQTKQEVKEEKEEKEKEKEEKKMEEAVAGLSSLFG